MKFFSFINFYLASGIRAGAQAFHSGHTMSSKYDKAPRRPEDAEYHMRAKAVYDEWADKHHTVIIKQGPGASEMWKLYERIRDLGQKLDLPFCRWYESKEALNGVLASVAIIVPESIYNRPPCTMAYANGEPMDAGIPEFELQQLVRKFPLVN
jgi:hypothetical protein